MHTLILGGIKSGKSRLAETLAQTTRLPVTLVATAQPNDEEMADRIAKHKSSRSDQWNVIEEPLSLAAAINQLGTARHCLLIDCLTLWLTQLLLLEDPARLKREIAGLLHSLKNTSHPVIMVTNETSMGIIPMGELTRRFCDEAGILHQQVAAHCGTVILTVAGLPLYLKGQPD